MKFNISKNIEIENEVQPSSLKEESDITVEKPVDASADNDETGANLDNTLGQSDLLKIYDDICPVSGDVFSAMKDAAKDPMNLKVTATKESANTKAAMYIEATEFAGYVEANSFDDLKEAADSIISAYSYDVPELANAEIHVVFPSKSINKDTLGGENLGLRTEDDWAMQLMRGCKRYGIIVNAGFSKATPTVETEAVASVMNTPPDSSICSDHNSETAKNIQKLSAEEDEADVVKEDAIDAAIGTKVNSIKKSNELTDKMEKLKDTKEYKDLMEFINGKKKAAKKKKYEEVNNK